MTIFSVSSPRPKWALGGGGGDSPSMVDMACIWAMVSVIQRREEHEAIYRDILSISVLTSLQHVPAHVNDYGMGIHSQFSLRRGRSAAAEQERSERTLKT